MRWVMWVMQLIGSLCILAALTACAARQESQAMGQTQAPSPTQPVPTAAAPATPVAQAANPQAPPLSPARFEKREFQSATLGRSMPYYAFLPPGYDANPDTRYPVLYMLHGLYVGYTEWRGYGLFDQAEARMTAGEIRPFIIVLPEGEQSYWVNHANGGPRWGDYLAQDVVGEIDQRYRTLANRDQRLVGGLSMGGHGALQLGLNYADVFGIVGAHAPTLRPQGTLPEYFGDEAYFAAHDPRPLFQSQVDQARTLRIWIDIGDEDEWFPEAQRLHRQLEQSNIPHTWRVFEGEHHDRYWTQNAGEYLRFYNDAFSQ
jgi:enterochelin esterase-like enzyme